MLHLLAVLLVVLCSLTGATVASSSGINQRHELISACSTEDRLRVLDFCKCAVNVQFRSLLNYCCSPEQV